MSVFTPPPINLKAFIADTQQPIALCFLNVHHERGGLDATGYDMLYGVLQMISEISLLLFPHSHGLEGFLMRRITMLSDRIAGTFHIFGEHIATRLSDARSAMNELPDLGVANEDIRRQNLKVWRRRLRTLHEPSKNDVKMYRHFLAYFDSEVHSGFLQLHRIEPEHNSWQLRHLLNHIRNCITSLGENIEEANRIVTELDTEFTLGTWGADGVQCAGKFEEEKESLAWKKSRRGKSAMLARSMTTNDMLESLDDFFERSESVIVESSLTTPQKQYGIASGGGEEGTRTPRIFTRSFDELEDSVRSLRLHHVNLSIDSDLDADGAVKVKDFALRTPCLLPSPATLLERREALCAREPAWEERLIGGQIVQSRRPHDRNRAHTVDERGGALDAWLAESPSPDKALERAGSVRGRVLHRQHTL